MGSRRYVAILLWLLIGQTLANQNPATSAMSLEALYSLAADQAPSLAIARYRSQAAKAQFAEARGAVLPQISLFGEW